MVRPSYSVMSVSTVSLGSIQLFDCNLRNVVLRMLFGHVIEQKVETAEFAYHLLDGLGTKIRIANIAWLLVLLLCRTLLF